MCRFFQLLALGCILTAVQPALGVESALNEIEEDLDHTERGNSQEKVEELLFLKAKPTTTVEELERRILSDQNKSRETELIPAKPKSTLGAFERPDRPSKQSPKPEVAPNSRKPHPPKLKPKKDKGKSIPVVNAQDEPANHRPPQAGAGASSPKPAKDKRKQGSTAAVKKLCKRCLKKTGLPAVKRLWPSFQAQFRAITVATCSQLSSTPPETRQNCIEGFKTTFMRDGALNPSTYCMDDCQIGVPVPLEALPTKVQPNLKFETPQLQKPEKARKKAQKRRGKAPQTGPTLMPAPGDPTAPASFSGVGPFYYDPKQLEEQGKQQAATDNAQDTNAAQGAGDTGHSGHAVTSYSANTADMSSQERENLCATCFETMNTGLAARKADTLRMLCRCENDCYSLEDIFVVPKAICKTLLNPITFLVKTSGVMAANVALCAPFCAATGLWKLATGGR